MTLLSLYLLGVLVSVVVLIVTIKRDRLHWGAFAVVLGLYLCPSRVGAGRRLPRPSQGCVVGKKEETLIEGILWGFLVYSTCCWIHEHRRLRREHKELMAKFAAEDARLLKREQLEWRVDGELRRMKKRMFGPSGGDAA